MPMSNQKGIALFHGFGTQDRKCLQGIRTGLDLTGPANQIVHAFKVLGQGCRIRVWNNRSNMLTRYKDGVARSHGFGIPDITCLERI